MAYFPLIFFVILLWTMCVFSKIFLEVWALEMWRSSQIRVTPLQPRTARVHFQSWHRTEAHPWVKTVSQSPPLPQLFHRISASQSRAPPPCTYGLHSALARGFSTRLNLWRWWQQNTWGVGGDGKVEQSAGGSAGGLWCRAGKHHEMLGTTGRNPAY